MKVSGLCGPLSCRCISSPVCHKQGICLSFLRGKRKLIRGDMASKRDNCSLQGYSVDARRLHLLHYLCHNKHEINFYKHNTRSDEILSQAYSCACAGGAYSILSLPGLCRGKPLMLHWKGRNSGHSHSSGTFLNFPKLPRYAQWGSVSLTMAQ